MATINLMTKCETKLDTIFNGGSITENWCGKDYDWEGVNAIKVYTLDTGELNDYDATASANRFGTPTEVTDEENVYPLKKKRSFAKTFDTTNVQDQKFIKNAKAYLKQMWDERYVPEIDTYRLKTWANGAGLGLVNTTALTKTTIAEALLTAHAEIDDAFVPSENRVTFVRTDVCVACKLADELKDNDGYTSNAIIRGKIGSINNSPIVSVPKSRMPKGIEFMIKYKRSSADPMKLRMLRANDNAPGIAGTLMEGLARYDSFVPAQKADGIYVYAQSGVCVAPTASISGANVTLATTTAGAAIKYTIDGTNPKTSATAVTYSAAVAITKDTKFRAYAEKAGMLNSAILAYDAVKV